MKETYQGKRIPKQIVRVPVPANDNPDVMSLEERLDLLEMIAVSLPKFEFNSHPERIETLQNAQVECAAIAEKLARRADLQAQQLIFINHVLSKMCQGTQA